MSTQFDLQDDSIVVIIGSGAGGGTLANALVQQGVPVLCLEAGPRLTAGDIVNNTAEMFGKMTWLDYRVGEGLPPDGLPVWNCKSVGGTTLHWTACCPRFQDFEFRALSTYGPMEDTNLVDWPFGLEEMAPYYDQAERLLGVTGTHGIPMMPENNNYKVMAAGARNLGYSRVSTYNMAINPEPRDGRPACLQLGFCSSGCAIGAKWSTLITEIPRAEQSDLFELRSSCMALALQTDGGERITGVRYRDAGGVEREQKARAVCVAGNVVETTRLLLNSRTERFPDGLANSSDQVGRNYMRHAMVQVFALMPGEVNMFKGAQCAGVVQDEVRHDPSRGFNGGFQMHTVGLDPEYIATNLMANGWGRDYAELIENYNRFAGLIVMGEDPPQASNRITLHESMRDDYGLPVPVVTYHNHPNTREMLDYATGVAQRLYESLGAEAVFTVEAFGATHNMGTARLGDDPASSVCNRWGQTHDIDNLFVSDGSLFPTAASANPTLTIVSLMLRQADYLAGEIAAGRL